MILPVSLAASNTATDNVTN